MPVLLVGQFVLLAGAVAIAGSLLARSADRIAEATGLGRLLVGSLLLAGVTSLPELSVDIAAIRSGFVDLAAGDLLGSSLMNLLILAVFDLSVRSGKKNALTGRSRSCTFGNIMYCSDIAGRLSHRYV
jgi:cation:H+ antiporter